MRFLGHVMGRGCALILATLVGSSCSSPAFRDFAAISAPPGVERATAIPELIDASGEVPVDLAPMLGRVVEQAHLPGVAAAVLRGDRVVAQGVAGVRRRGMDFAITIDDPFHIASCAKAMSAMLVARLVEEGRLEWDRPISRYFPDEPLHPDWDRVTLRHLITHTAGLRDPLATFLRSVAFDRGPLAERRLAFARRVLRSKPHSPPGSRMVYGNVDYIVAAAVAEQVTGTAWEQLMATHVFRPLGLESAGFGPPGPSNETLQPWGHGKYRLMLVGMFGNAAFDPASRAADYPAIASPAGYIHLNIGDWARFVALHLRAHPANPHRTVAVLRPDTFETLHDEMRPGIGYAGGWFVDTRSWAKGVRPTDTGRVLFHLGDNGRWTSAVWVAPELDFAVLVTCNRGNMEPAIDELVGQLIRAYARPESTPAQ